MVDSDVLCDPYFPIREWSLAWPWKQSASDPYMLKAANLLSSSESQFLVLAPGKTNVPPFTHIDFQGKVRGRARGTVRVDILMAADLLFLKRRARALC